MKYTAYLAKDEAPRDMEASSLIQVKSGNYGHQRYRAKAL